jgi:O-antigen/teichoic acid export membrane protein
VSYIENPNYKKLLAEKTFWLFTGRAMPVIILFLITILYSRRLSYDDYGKFQSVWMYTNIINVFIAFGVTQVLLSSNLSFLFTFIKRHSLKIAAFYSLLWIIVLTAFFWYGKNFYSSTKYLLILFIIIQNVITVFETLQIKNHKEKFVFAINFFYSLLFFAWHYYVLVNGFNLNNLIAGIAVIALVKAGALLFFTRKHEEASIEPSSGKAFFKHWAYLGINDISGVLAKWIDKLFLLYLLTAGEFAIFFNGSFEIPLFGLLISVVGSVLLIDISVNILAKEKVIKIFNEGFRMLSIIVFPLFLFLFLFRVELFATIFNHKYDASIPIFVISIFILPVRINNYSSILQCYSLGNKILTGSILDICIILTLMFFLYPVMGTKGVALAIVTGTYCQAFYYLWQSAKVLNTDILSLVPLKALLVTFLIMSILFTALYYGLYKTSYQVRLFGGAIVTTIMIMTSGYLHFSKHSTTYGFIAKNKLKGEG